MPLYEYECLSCGHRTEVLQSFSAPPPAQCPDCGGAVKKLPSAPSVQFKGSGWYVTDYASKKPGESKSESKSDSSGDSVSSVSESKPATSGTEKSTASDSATKSAADSPKK